MDNNELKERFIDEKTGIEYIRKGDYYFPNLVDSASVKANELSKYGKLRLKYLLEHKKVDYTILWVENKLRSHLLEIDKTANKRFNLLMKQFTALQEMRNTKKQFFKTTGIQCFHGVQSFVKGEVTQEQAHEIGIKLAEELWGNKFQVIVSTHLNTDNLHNHFVLNYVSFLDGKRFCNTKKDYATMRKASDKLCEEYGLSVLKQEEKYNKYTTSSLYKELMKDSIDYAIANAKDYNEFIKILQDLDYIVTDKNNTLSIRQEPCKRNTRIERQFGNSYSKESIYKRILETQP